MTKIYSCMQMENDHLINTHLLDLNLPVLQLFINNLAYKIWLGT